MAVAGDGSAVIPPTGSRWAHERGGCRAGSRREDGAVSGRVERGLKTGIICRDQRGVSKKRWKTVGYGELGWNGSPGGPIRLAFVGPFRHGGSTADLIEDVG